MTLSEAWAKYGPFGKLGTVLGGVVALAAAWIPLRAGFHTMENVFSEMKDDVSLAIPTCIIIGSMCAAGSAMIISLWYGIVTDKIGAD